MINFFLVMLGGALGSGLRYGVTLLTDLISPLSSHNWVATLVVNVVGSFLIGYLSAYAHGHCPSSRWFRPFFIVGLCGGFTTFSTFAMDLYGQYSRGAMVTMVLYLVSSVVLSLLALLAGIWAASRTR